MIPAIPQAIGNIYAVASGLDVNQRTRQGRASKLWADIQTIARTALTADQKRQQIIPIYNELIALLTPDDKTRLDASIQTLNVNEQPPLKLASKRNIR